MKSLTHSLNSLTHSLSRQSIRSNTLMPHSSPVQTFVGLDGDGNRVMALIGQSLVHTCHQDRNLHLQPSATSHSLPLLPYQVPLLWSTMSSSWHPKRKRIGKRMWDRTWKRTRSTWHIAWLITTFRTVTATSSKLIIIFNRSRLFSGWFVLVPVRDDAAIPGWNDQRPTC